MTQVLIVDEDIRSARSLEDHLKRKGYRVTIAATGADGLDLAVRQTPDVLVMDVNLPGLNGLDVCRRLRSYPIQSDVPVLFLSAKDSATDRVAGLEAGGDDYVSKPFDAREVELRIQALLRRQRGKGSDAESPEMAVGDLLLDKRTFRARIGKREVQLTPVEYELLRYLMQRAGEVVSAEQLLQEVWRYYPGTGDTAVVRVQIMNLRDKIEHDRRQPAYIRTVYRHGYMVHPASAAEAAMAA